MQENLKKEPGIDDEKKLPPEVDSQGQRDLLNYLLKEVTNLQIRIAGLEKQCDRQVINGEFVVGDSILAAVMNHVKVLEFEMSREIARLNQRINYFHP